MSEHTGKKVNKTKAYPVYNDLYKEPYWRLLVCMYDLSDVTYGQINIVYMICTGSTGSDKFI
jgi:hypothetical protein